MAKTKEIVWNIIEQRRWVNCELVETRVTGDRVRREQMTVRLTDGTEHRLSINRFETMARSVARGARSGKPAAWRVALGQHMQQVTSAARSQAASAAVSTDWRARRARALIRAVLKKLAEVVNAEVAVIEREELLALVDVGAMWDAAAVQQVQDS